MKVFIEPAIRTSAFDAGETLAKQKATEIGKPTLPPERAILRLKQRIQDLENFDPATVTKRFSTEVELLQTAIAETLSNAFGQNTPEFDRYEPATRLDSGTVWLDSPAPVAQVHSWLAEGKDKAIKLLQLAVRGLEEKLEDVEPLNNAAIPVTKPARDKTRKVFLVHGHDEGPREAVARFLEQLKFDPIILHEKANSSRTVIEKIEANSDVGFAVVLITPDDIGGLKGGDQHPRARQNVLLELGYFVGLLGRKNVCALKRGEVEIPSDWQGVVNEPFDANGAWKQTLARELQEAEYDIDWNLVMKR